jgi:hypothetical protein
MKTTMCNLVRAILIVAVAVGCGLAQEVTPVPAPEKHVYDIKAEQTREVLLASPLCQRARANPKSANGHTFRLDAATFESDMSSLMEKSDEVVLASWADNTTAISPSGEDAVQYFDYVVLRTWKGSHKVGDTLTFANPSGYILCYSQPTDRDQSFKISPSSKIRPVATTEVTPPPTMWYTGVNSGSPTTAVLFLRKSRGSETQLTEGLRLAGGEGTQGMYGVDFNPTTQESITCDGRMANPKSISHCNAILGATQLPISFEFDFNEPLRKRYDGMPFSSFLQEMRSVAESLGYTEQTTRSK